MVTPVIEKLLLIKSTTDDWKCKPFRIQTQLVSMDSSQCPLSKHVSPLCEGTTNHLFTRSIRNDSKGELRDLKHG